MKLYEITSQGQLKSYLDVATKEQQALIQKNCQPYLREAGDLADHLFRGMILEGPTEFADIDSSQRSAWGHASSSNVDDSPGGLREKKLRDVANKFFVDKFGFPYRNTVYCSGDPTYHAGYGDVYWVFPKGQYTYCWSPQIADLVPDVMWPLRKIKDDAEYQQQFIQAMESGQYSTTNLQMAIRSGKEIMMNVKSYYIIGLCTAYDFQTNRCGRNKGQGEFRTVF